MAKAKTVTQVSALNAIREAMQNKFKEREALVEAMLVALLAREHLFILGPPGTAKSAICQTLCNAITGKYFVWQTSKFTTPEDLFGPTSLKALEQGSYERVTDNKLPQADIVLIDEPGKASSAIANTLLSCMNERIFFNGAKPEKIPLQVMFGASNEIPSSEELGAFFDRWALRYQVNRLENDLSVKELFLSAGTQQSIPKITLKELAEEQTAAMALQLPDETLENLITLRKLVHEKGIAISDRKWMQSLNIVKAYAHLNGHSEVEVADLEILEHVLWNEPSQIKTARLLVRKVCNPVGEQITKILDAATEVYEAYKRGGATQSKSAIVETQSKVRDGIKKLEALQVKGTVNKTLTEALAKLRKQNIEILKELGIENL